jgi:site-specific recombinase XerD
MGSRLTARSTARTAADVGDIRTLIPSWGLHLDAENLAARSMATYLRTLRQFADFLVAHGMPTDVAKISGEHVDAFRVHVRDRQRARGRDGSVTANTYRAHLLQFFNWAVEEGERTDNPVARLKPMKEPTRLVPVVPDDALDHLLRGCSGTAFVDRRDLALIGTLLDTGARESEILVDLEDVDLQRSGLRVWQKGGRENFLPIGRKTRRDLDRYIRARASHPHAAAPELWLGLRGPLTPSGIYQVLENRCRAVGLDRINPHRLRHTFAHQWLANGGNEHELAHIAGWTSTQMVARYARSAAGERAREAHRHLSPRDRF